jgi:hypothetical protein
MECASSDLYQKYFFAEVKRRRNFRQWTPAKTSKIELPWSPREALVEKISGNDDLFLFGGYGPVCAVYNAKTGEILQQWSPVSENEEIEWVDTAASLNGKHVFMIAGRETESEYLQVRNF